MTALRDDPLVAATLAKFPGADIVDVQQIPRLQRPATKDRVPASNWSLGALAALAREEAFRIEETQDRLVRAGDRETACVEQLRRRDGFESMARLVERVKADAVIMDRFKKGLA